MTLTVNTLLRTTMLSLKRSRIMPVKRVNYRRLSDEFRELIETLSQASEDYSRKAEPETIPANVVTAMCV